MTIRRMGGGGGGASGMAVRSFLPSSATATLDPNSIVASATIDGDWLEVDLQNPGAYPLPTQGAIWDCGALVDAYGDPYTPPGSDSPWIHGVRSDAVLPPADTWVGALFATAAPNVAGVESFGIMLDSTGNLVTYQRNSAGTEQSTASVDNAAELRIAMLRVMTGNTTLARYGSGLGYDGSGNIVAARGLGLALTVGGLGFSRAWLAAGWLAGTGGPTATVRLSGRTLGALASRLVSEGGL